MGNIRVMSEALTNKIAAGEVVERCSSVVKELVENSIDAGSTFIEVSLIDAGMKEIKVKDNGKGMDESDAVLCFTPHATSKIKNENDLYFINTLGFRGEALPSIASVSEITLETTNKQDRTKVVIKGGILESEEDSTINEGTIITVDNLFYNTPARLKFLKSFYTELNNIIALLEKLALSHPNISFVLKSDGKDVLKTTGSSDLLKTIHEIYGYNVAKNMIYIKGSNDDYDIEGYVSNLNITKSTKKDMITLVNGRVVTNQYVNRIIKDAYHSLLMIEKYPITVININVDPTIVDVNIHPTKQDIKFSKMDTLEELLFALIRDKLIVKNEIRDAVDKKEENYNYFNSYDLNETLTVNERLNDTEIKEDIPKFYEETKINFYAKEDTTGYNATLETKDEEPSLMHTLGLAMGTYLFATDEENVYMIDIHAANERINYERFLRALKMQEVSKTDMLFPVNLEFTTNEYMKIIERKDFISSLGIDFDEFGSNTIRVTSHPTWFLEGQEEDSLKEVFDMIVSFDKDFDRVKFNEHIAIRLACKKSVKANTNIGMLERETLVKRLFECEFPYTCPHGRPTTIKYSKYDLEKLFKRVV